MKQINLLTLFMVLISAHLFGQTPHFLSGTLYTQDFDNLSAGLPSGWRVDTSVDHTMGLGGDALSRFSSTNSSWGVTSRGFYNYAAADGTGMNASSTSTDQNNCTDRALGVKQVSAWDASGSQVDFAFYIANTTGLSNFNLSFNLQTFPSGGGRYNTWMVQYGIGTNPSVFTTVVTVPATLNVDSTFNNTNVTVNFGSALDNSSQPVWIRMTPSGPSSGAGNRPVVAIDDFNLTWTGTATGPPNPIITTLTPANGSTNVPVNANLMIDFDKNVTLGSGDVTIFNITDATQQTITLPNANVTVSGMTVTISGNSFAYLKNYAVQFDSTCVLAGTYKSFGIYNNSTWAFTTEAQPIPVQTSLNETFTGCNAPVLGLFTSYSVTGGKEWSCSYFGRTDSNAAYMNGYQGGSLDNEDWLISPLLDFSGMGNPYLHFWSKKRFNGTNTKEVFVSTDYSGSGDPNLANWTNLNVGLTNLDTFWQFYPNTNLGGVSANNFYLAFKYVSSVTGTADEWNLDDIYVTDGPVGLSNFTKEAFQCLVLGDVTDEMDLRIISDRDRNMEYEIYDMTGSRISGGHLVVAQGKAHYQLDIPYLSNGMYVFQIHHSEGRAVLKFSIR